MRQNDAIFDHIDPPGADADAEPFTSDVRRPVTSPLGARPIFLRTTLPTPPGTPLPERMHACVRNTGNYFFEEALLRQLRGTDTVLSLDDLPDRAGTLVLSMSNFISGTTDLGYLHDALAARHVSQVVMIGAGVQNYTYDQPVDLTPGTMRFLRFVADRSTTIGVRGYYTAEILARLGIRNVEVIGCPAAFWHADAPAIRGAPLPDAPALAVHATPLGHFRDKISALLHHGMRHGAAYVIQSEAWLLELLRGNEDCAVQRECLDYYSHPCCDPAELRAWLRRKLRVFFDMPSWIAESAKWDFVYGARFHGNMAAIAAGTPALNMPFDTRTRELCDYLHLPVLPLDRFRADLPLAELRAMADFDTYRRLYPAKRAAYQAFLERNGLAHAFASPPGTHPAPSGIEAQTLIATLRGLLDDLGAAGPLDAGLIRDLVLRRTAPDRQATTRLLVEAGCCDG